MDVPRRFIFRGNASGVAAHIRRPENMILPVQAASSLPVIGGISESKAGPANLGKYLSFQSSHTYAHGDYVDEQAAEAMTYGGPYDKVPTQTVVASQVVGLQVGSRDAAHRLSIGIVTAGLVSASQSGGSSQPPIQLKGNRIDQVRVDGALLQITLNESPCNENDTMEALLKNFPRLENQQAMFLQTATNGAPSPLVSNGIAYATIVEKMTWLGTPPKGADIKGNILILEGFGAVYFGELLISELSRRLTMVRFELGSPVGGSATAAEVETNGTIWP